jgi:hypothetical protein
MKNFLFPEHGIIRIVLNRRGVSVKQNKLKKPGKLFERLVTSGLDLK